MAIIKVSGVVTDAYKGKNGTYLTISDDDGGSLVLGFPEDLTGKVKRNEPITVEAQVEVRKYNDRTSINCVSYNLKKKGGE